MNKNNIFGVTKYLIIFGLTLLLNEKCLAESVSVIKDNDISVTLSKIKRSNCIVNIKAPNLEFQKVSKISKQNRFVINLRGVPFSKSHIATSSICSITKIRVQQKEHTSQIILEMKKNVEPTYSYSKTKDTFSLILLNLKEKKEQQVSPTLSETPSISEIPTISETSTKTPTNTPTPEVNESIEVNESPTPSVTESEIASETVSETPSPTEDETLIEETSTSVSETPTISETQTSSPTPEASESIETSESPTPSVTESEIASETKSKTPSSTEDETLTEETNISISETQTISESKSSSPTPEASELTTVSETPTNSPTTKISESPIPSVTESEETEDSVTEEETNLDEAPTPTQDQAGIHLEKINFEFMDEGTPAIVLSLTQKSHFSFQQKDEDHYILLVPEININAEHLLLPYFAPQDFAPFISSIAKNTTEGIEVEITADKGATLTAIPADKKIMIIEEK